MALEKIPGAWHPSALGAGGSGHFGSTLPVRRDPTHALSRTKPRAAWRRAECFFPQSVLAVCVFLSGDWQRSNTAPSQAEPAGNWFPMCVDTGRGHPCLSP